MCGGMTIAQAMASPREKATTREVIETVFSLQTSWRRDVLLILSHVGRLGTHIVHGPGIVISDFRPTSVTGSGEAVLRRLLASRAIESDSLTFDDPAPGSLTVFQSSRVARPQDASRAPDLVPLLSS